MDPSLNRSIKDDMINLAQSGIPVMRIPSTILAETTTKLPLPHFAVELTIGPKAKP